MLVKFDNHPPIRISPETETAGIEQGNIERLIDRDGGQYDRVGWRQLICYTTKRNKKVLWWETNSGCSYSGRGATTYRTYLRSAQQVREAVGDDLYHRYGLAELLEPEKVIDVDALA